jgi:HK97 family phage portal protein
VYADIQLIANLFSTSTIIVKERKGDKLEDVDNHPLEMIWESPNEHMGRSFVSSFWAWSYTLVGKAYLYWVPDVSGNELMEVWPIPPWMIRAIPDKDNFIRAYAFRASADAEVLTIPAEYITYSHSVNPFDIRDGMSFLVAADTEIRADLAAGMWNLNFFDANNGVPDGLIGLDPNALDQDVERVRMELRDFFGGTKRGVAVARSNDLKWQEFGRSQKDMEFGAGREFASKVIGRTLGIPDAIWSELSNRANAEQAMRTLINGAVWPLLVRLSEDMNAKRLGVVQRWYGDLTRVEFKDIRPEDKEAKRAELVSVQPFYTLNKLLELTGDEPFDKDDPRGLMLVAEITKGAPIPGTPAAKLLEDLQAKKDAADAEAQAQAAADAIAAGDMPDPNEAPPEGELPPDDQGAEAMPDAVEGAPASPAPDEALPMKSLIERMGDQALTDFISEEMDRWERKAIKAFKARGKAAVGFESDAIDPDDHARISDALKAAQDVAAVKAAFKKDAVDTLLDSVDADARAWAEEATGE